MHRTDRRRLRRSRSHAERSRIKACATAFDTSCPTDCRPAEIAALRCGDVLSYQVLLDRQGFSPGEIERTDRFQLRSRAGGVSDRAESRGNRAARLRHVERVRHGGFRILCHGLRGHRRRSGISGQQIPRAIEAQASLPASTTSHPWKCWPSAFMRRLRCSSD